MTTGSFAACTFRSWTGWVISGKMAKGGARVSDADIDTLRQWIEGGALQDSAAETKVVFEREIFSSILGAKCFVCHGRREQKGGLDLRTVAGLLKGGKS